MSIFDNIFFWRQPIKNKLTSMWEDLKPIDMAKIQVVPFPENKIFKQEFKKTQVVLHHTVSGDGVEGDIETWEGLKDSVATAFIIDRAGTPWQLFSSKYWAYHLAAGNHDLDRHSIGIEIDNWGWMIPGDGTIKQFGFKQDGTPKLIQTQMGKYYTYYGNSVAVPLQYYSEGFRGYKFYEKYSESQLRTVGQLILYWKIKYGITLDYNEDMWDVSPRALRGEPGIWTHVSYRPASQKTDCHPQEDLIEMLKTLSSIK